MRGLLIATVASAMAFAGVVACDSDEPTPVETSGAGASAAGGAGGEASGFAASECGGCVLEQCQPQWSACDDDAECAQYLECFNGCPQEAWGDADAFCEQQCPRTAASKPLIDALLTCRLTGPGSGCASCNTLLGNGQYAHLLNQNCGASTEQNECFRCQDENVCDSYEERLNSPDGLAFRDCYVDCSNATGVLCGEQCYAQHPGGLPLWAAEYTAYLAQCQQVDACNDGMPFPPCSVCLNETCDATNVEANAFPAGFLYADCLNGCAGDQACGDACGVKYAPALGVVSAWTACVEAACPMCT